MVIGYNCEEAPIIRGTCKWAGCFLFILPSESPSSPCWSNCILTGGPFEAFLVCPQSLPPCLCWEGRLPWYTICCGGRHTELQWTIERCFCVWPDISTGNQKWCDMKFKFLYLFYLYFYLDYFYPMQQSLSTTPWAHNFSHHNFFVHNLHIYSHRYTALICS